MKILRFQQDSGWVTRIIYRKSMNDIVIKQYKLKSNEEEREIYIFDDKRNVIKELKSFFKSLR